MSDRVEEIARREWPGIEKALSPPQSASALDPFWLWRYRVTPGIPVTWPPEKGCAEFDYYLWAAGMNPGLLTDGERYTAPWGMIRANLINGHYEFYSLAWDPSAYSTQGVRPLRRDEIQIVNDSQVQQDFAHALAEGILPAELEMRVQAYYGLWASNQAVTKLIRPRHPAFFSWLGEYRGLTRRLDSAQ